MNKHEKLAMEMKLVDALLKRRYVETEKELEAIIEEDSGEYLITIYEENGEKCGTIPVKSIKLNKVVLSGNKKTDEEVNKEGDDKCKDEDDIEDYDEYEEDEYEEDDYESDDEDEDVFEFKSKNVSESKNVVADKGGDKHACNELHDDKYERMITDIQDRIFNRLYEKLINDMETRLINDLYTRLILKR